MRFVDFVIRAWREMAYLQVMAHSTPAGNMRQPAAVKLGPFAAEDYRIRDWATSAEAAALGRQLARLLFPDAVWRLFAESLRAIAGRKDIGLRLRLCLDDDLIDLPWEFLYRPDVQAPAARSGFLLLDGRISLVREPPLVLGAPAATSRVQRGLFVGAFFADGSDTWGVQQEHASLTKAMRSVQDFVEFEFVRADAGSVDREVESGCDIFHYAGHTMVEDGRGAMVQLARMENAPSGEQLCFEMQAERAAWSRADQLAPRLGRAGTRLAVFNACNSGYWPFVSPFMRAGLPALVGVQGTVGNVAALNFSARLYESLAVGLSLDEALTFARIHLFEPGRREYECDWGRFMVYMPAESAVLFPRPEREGVQHLQTEIRKERERTIGHVHALLETMDGAAVSRMLSDVADRTVLILGRFTAERKAVLEAIKTALAARTRPYVPILFDFEKPGERDLIESILRFAAVSRFVIADLSDPKSIPAELQAIVPQFPSLPVVPIIEAGQREYPVSDNILRRDSVARPIVHYRDIGHLMEVLEEQVLGPAEALYAELRPAPLVIV
jgi:hypothetical protein